MTRRLTVEADGGSRGNPGVAGYGALVRDTDTGALLAERAEPLGKQSNNVAEYRGLVAGLEAAFAIDPSAEVHVRLDSKLVVEQMSGRWKIKHEDMRRLALQARDLVSAFTRSGGSVRFEWIPRADNKDADALSNVAMDGRVVDRTFGGPSQADAVVEEAEPDDQPSTGAARRAAPSRVVLVAETSAAGAGSAATAVAELLGGQSLTLLTAPGDRSVETAAHVAAALGSQAVVDGGWTQERAADAWARVVTSGGTTVVVCSPDTVRAVLAHLLGIPDQRRSRLAVAEGSLAGIEVWDGDEVSVAFTNRS